MKANDTKVENFLEGKKQFKVPLFQRTYSWEEKDIKKLWRDLKDTKEDQEYLHFFGSFVTMPIPTGPGIPDEYIVIDGQQRLTTIFTLLAALRNQIIEIQPDYKNRDEIYESYLINKFQPSHKYKLIPTQADRKIFFSIIDELNPIIDTDHMLMEVYNFFRNEFSKFDSISELIEYKDALLSRFLVVDIYLEKDDDPYLIFESLNGTGVPLTQADLVRNYLFMRLDPNDQQAQQDFYDKLWFPMQEELEDSLEYFFRHYLSMDGSITNFNKIYYTFKEIHDEKAKNQDDIINIMENISRFSKYYSKFIYPENEEDERLKVYFEKFNRLEVTTVYPLLLKLYDDYENYEITTDEFIKCLSSIETFIVRRAVCRVPTNALNNYFPAVYNTLDKSNIPGSLKEKFKSGSGALRMPDNSEFKENLKERRLYRKTSRYILEELEKYLDDNEPVNLEDLQVEHIMPQTLNDDWKEELGDDCITIHQKYLDTLGNLTLTGYNPQYSNKSFIEKRDMKNGFKDSNIKLNRKIAELDAWNKKEIVDRANDLTSKALKIWRI